MNTKMGLGLLSILVLVGSSGCWKKDEPGPGGGGGGATYSVSVAVSGLAGTGLVLRNNGGDSLAINSNGTATFATQLTTGAAYAVTVATQPSTPTQTCSVSNGSGTIASSNVGNVAVTCVTNTYSVGGTVSGLTGSGLALRNNGGDDLAVNASGAFTFATSVASAGTYDVTVLAQPSNPSQTCTVTAGAGIVVSSNIADVVVACVTNSSGIGPQGGTVDAPYGAQVMVPPGALSTNVDVAINRDSDGEPNFPLADSGDVNVIGATHRLTPHGTSFALSAVVRIPFDPARLPADATPKLFKAEQGGAFAEIPSTVDGDRLVANIDSFSWAIPASAATWPRSVYALSSGGVAAYRMTSSATNMLVPINTVLSGPSPISIVAHPSRRFVYVTNGSGAPSNGVNPYSVSVYSIHPITGALSGPTSTRPASVAAINNATIVAAPANAVVHPSGKFVYVVNMARPGEMLDFPAINTDLSLFQVNPTTGALSDPVSIASSGGAPPTALAFAPSGNFAFVTYGWQVGTPVGNTYTEQVKTFSVDAATGALTGPLSGVPSGGHPRAIVVEPLGKFAYVASGGTDEVRIFGINATTGALTYWGGPTISSKPVSLAIDSQGRFLYVGKEDPYFNVNVETFEINSFSGALSPSGAVLAGSGVPGSAISVVAEPQGQFVFVLANSLVTTYKLNPRSSGPSTVPGLAPVGTIPAITPSGGGIRGALGIPFAFAATGTSPIWKNGYTIGGCRINCAISGGGGGGGGGGAPVGNGKHYLQVSHGAWGGWIYSNPMGTIDYGHDWVAGPPPKISAELPEGSSIELCETPPPVQISGQAFDVEWTGGCRGTGRCTTVKMDGDKYCHLELKLRQ